MIPGRPPSTFAAVSAPVSQVGLQSLQRRNVTHIVLERDVDCSFVADLPDLTRVDAMVKIGDDGPLWTHPGIEHLFLDFATRVPMDATALPRLTRLTVGRRPGLESLGTPSARGAARVARCRRGPDLARQPAALA